MNSARPVRPSNKIKRYSQQEIFSNTFNRPNDRESEIKNKEDYNNTENYPKNFPNNFFNNEKNIMAVTKDKKIFLNVEDLLIQEDKLYKILENIRLKVNFNISTEEYLEFTHITSNQLFEIFFEEKYKENIHQAQILEFISVILSIFVYLKDIVIEKPVEHVKNILFYIHQNLILMIILLLKKISKEYQNNFYVLKLKELVNKKRNKLMSGDEQFLIEQNNKIILSSINYFIEIYLNKTKKDIKIFLPFNDILKNINTISFEIVKNNLFELKNTLTYTTKNKDIAFVHINLEGPFLPPIEKKYEYTLVLDLDETIIHCLSQPELIPLIRPGTKEFLCELSKYYEIVIFTASVQEYADLILNEIDKNKKWISHRLYREHTTVIQNTYLKDISKLGRDLNKVIIIDNACGNFQLQSDNGIFVQTWIGDKDDDILFNLIPVLKEIVIKKIPDVRKALRKVRDTMIRFYVKGDISPYCTVVQYITGERKLTE